MADVFSKAKRSEVMSRIRGRGNKDTEIVLANLFRRHGITGWRRHIQVRSAERGTRNTAVRLRVRPDFVFRKERVAVFVDGCFWHGCPKHCRMPAGNRAFWRKKLTANRERDRRVNRELRRAGWRVVRIWEHELRKPGRCLARVRGFIRDL